MISDEDRHLFQSAPVDVANPSFASLLDAMRVVHEGTMPVTVLSLYHAELLRQWRQWDTMVQSRLAVEPDNAELRVQLAPIGANKILLEHLQAYVASPSQERMTRCVESYLMARRMTEQVRAAIDLGWLKE